MLFRLLISSCLSLILVQSIANARTLKLVRPKLPDRRMQEGDSASVKKGAKAILDLSQGFFIAIKDSSFDVPIYRAERGGNRSLFRLWVGKVTGDFRHLNSKFSFIKFVNFQKGMANAKSVSVSSVGTVFTTEATPTGLIIGVAEGKVAVDSGGAGATAIVGQGATLDFDKPPVIYLVDYRLEVEDLKVREEQGKNVVTGKLTQGNTIMVQDGVVTMNGRCFRVVTRQQFLIITNPNGTERYLFFGGRADSVGPFYE
jgi:hypothetical protein